MKHFRLKKDRFLKIKGGTSKILVVSCQRCGLSILTYQKDGIGGLKRCYLDRILAPQALAGLHSEPCITSTKSMPRLICSGCGVVVGVPMRHHTGRLAFHLFPGTFQKGVWRRDPVESSVIPETATPNQQPAASGKSPPAIQL
jgi:hypothetical protein